MLKKIFTLLLLVLLAVLPALVLDTVLSSYLVQAPVMEDHEPATSNSVQAPVKEDYESATSEGIESTVTIAVTRDFGKELIFERSIDIQDNTSAMQALKEVAEIETAYGGGFVNAINGISSQYPVAKKDWFYYINGILSDVGALDYTLRPGDFMHWDFHDWSFHMFIPATIGAFPETFREGFRGKTRPTLIVYSGNFKQAAVDLANYLSQLGVTDVAARSLDELQEKEKRSSNLILIGTADNELIAELNSKWKRLGFFSYIEEDAIVTLDETGKESGRYSTGAGLIQATQNPWNPKGTWTCENVVWMVTGIDETGVERAIEVLMNRSAELRYANAAVVVNGQIIKVPVSITITERPSMPIQWRMICAIILIAIFIGVIVWWRRKVRHA